MTDVIYVVFCESCQTTTEIVSVVDEWLDGKPMNGHYACSQCGRQCGVWYDGGTLDLGVVRQSTGESESDVWVYTGPYA